MKAVDKKDIELISSEMGYQGEPAEDTSWLIVNDEDMYSVAQTLKEGLNDRIKEIAEYFKPRKQRASAVHKDWVAAETEALKPYMTEKGSLQGKQNAYLSKKEKERKVAVEKITEAAGPEAAVFIPPAEKAKGTRTTITGEVVDINLFIGWLIAEGSVEAYVDIKKAAVNALAKTISTSKKEIPGFKAVKNVTAV